MANLLVDGWKSFEADVIPAAAPAHQRDSMKMAFYAGVAVLLDALMISLDPGSEPTERDLAKLRAVRAELRAFADSMKNRGARPN